MQKVMVVDNNPVVLKYMESFLVKNGFSVRTAENGLAALDLLKDYTPDIFFIDLIMPYIKGEMLVSILRDREELSNIRIIILSGVAAEIDLNNLNGDTVVKQVVGLESVFKRSITEELMLAKLHTEVILESISDCLIEISTDFRIVYLNKAALLFFNKKQKSS